MSKKNDLIGLVGLGALMFFATRPSQSRSAAVVQEQIITPEQSSALAQEVLSIPVPQGTYIDPSTSAPLAPEEETYNPFNTSLGDLQANIAWGLAQGFRLLKIDGERFFPENNNTGFKAYMVR